MTKKEVLQQQINAMSVTYVSNLCLGEDFELPSVRAYIDNSYLMLKLLMTAHI